MSVAWRELIGSPEEEYGSGGMRATRTIMCAWADRHAVLMDVLGNGYGIGGTGAKRYPGQDAVWVVSAKVKPFTSDPASQVFTDIETNLNSYGDCVITLQYELIRSNWPVRGENGPTTEPQTVRTIRVSGALEPNWVSCKGMKWIAPDSPGAEPKQVTEDDLGMQLRVGMTEWVATWHRVIAPPRAQIQNLLGKINGHAWQGFKAETLLFDSWSADTEFVLLDGFSEIQTAWKLTYVFREKLIQLSDTDKVRLSNLGPIGWPYLYRSKPVAQAGWARIVDRNNEPIYIPTCPPTHDAELDSGFDPLFRYA
jgi:hypothetical protein